MKLSAYLAQSGMTPAALARQAGISHTTVYRILSGEQVPGPPTRRKIERATAGLVTGRELLIEAAELLPPMAALEVAA